MKAGRVHDVIVAADSVAANDDIVIEERSAKELLNTRGGLGEQVAASGTDVWYPAFDVEIAKPMRMVEQHASVKYGKQRKRQNRAARIRSRKRRSRVYLRRFFESVHALQRIGLMFLVNNVIRLGVEDVKTDWKTHTIVVKGKKADPLKVLEKIHKKSHCQIELISPVPKSPAE
ncbi:hypothetical protein L6452_15651 [Arctium lappa]|uniref:Uncharacterized protein n=1 Tax=Arctium lappa TaxID=4217 RepID=A0ACB9CP57_ARCLA|nr:hypothetical protein L6452_15651 [Arctium lappa]